MKIVFLGATSYSREMLLQLVNNNFNVNAVFMIPQSFELKKKGEKLSRVYNNSNYSDLRNLTKRYSIPCYVVDSTDGHKLKDYTYIFERIQPDIILVLGWYYLVPKSMRDIAKLGAVGIHASLLPAYAGGSPLVWAIINGETKTGITMFRLENGVDDGDILAQKEIRIDIDDTIATLYEKVTDASKFMLVDVLNKIIKNEHVYIKQDRTKIQPFPIRTPDDGKINWSMTDVQIYNFVRAQTKPYPCAFSLLNGICIKIVSTFFPNKTHDCLSKYAIGEIVLHDNKYFVKAGNNLMQINIIEVDDREQNFNDYCKDNNLQGANFDSD